MTEFKRTVTDPEAFGRVAVLMGGDSAEREISLKSGNQVLAGLKESGIEAHKLDATGDFLTTLQTGNFDRVFNIGCCGPASSNSPQGNRKPAPKSNSR